MPMFTRIVTVSCILLLPILLTTPAVFAKIVTQKVEYQDGTTPLEGYVAYDDALTGPQPAVLIVHQWMGLTDYERGRAKQLAEMGYVAFAVDMYGKGVRPANTEEASKESSKYSNDRQLMRRRVIAGLDKLRSMPNVDKAHIDAIGYCFGGGVVLELARSGADIAGVVAFHGTVSNPNPADAANIKCKVLVCHGADDPYVPMKTIEAFWKEMAATDVDWQLNLYGNAVHAFTQKGAGDDNSKGAAYNANADRRSWEAMKRFFDETLK